MDSDKIGKFLKHLREEKQLSQNELAEKLYVSRTLVNKWERGKANLTLANLKVISEYFNISVDEILLGERENKNNKEEISNIKYKIYNENNHLRKKIKIFLFIVLLLVIAFLFYFFVTFYNSVEIYTVDANSNLVEITNGILIKTRDKIYFRFESNFEKSDLMKEITIFYELEDGRKLICRSNNFDSVFINDFYKTQEYFDFSKFNKIRDNLYMEIKYKDDSSSTIKLSLYRDYVNSNIFLWPNKKNNINREVIDDKFSEDQAFKDIYENYNNQHFQIKYNNQEYEIKVTDEYIAVDSQDKIIRYYEDLSCNLLIKSNKESMVEEYIYDIGNDFCIDGDCQEFNPDYDLFKQILKNLEE